MLFEKNVKFTSRKHMSMVPKLYLILRKSSLLATPLNLSTLDFGNHLLWNHEKKKKKKPKNVAETVQQVGKIVLAPPHFLRGGGQRQKVQNFSIKSKNFEL